MGASSKTQIGADTTTMNSVTETAQTQIAGSHSPRKATDRVPSLRHILKTSLRHLQNSVSNAAARWVDIPEGEAAIQKIREMARRYEEWNEQRSSGIFRAPLVISTTQKPRGSSHPVMFENS